MRSSTALVFALFFTSMVVAAPVTPVTSSTSVSEVATQATAATNIAVPAGDIISAVLVNDQSEINFRSEYIHMFRKFTHLLRKLAVAASVVATLKNGSVDISICAINLHIPL
ncbi:hypothetical protein C8R45DRAFT_1097688 [Mycena sanguinolenta]|nr:hypothetical protein C8R45DRAFT_1097688 [Mycena sanguinolenta]